MASQITANLPTLDFPREVDYPTQEDWAAFSAAAEENFGILGNGWSTQMQLWKTEANAMSAELNNSADIAQGLADYQGDWISQGYTLGQTVSVSGIYYICKLTHATGQNPTDVSSLYWNLALGNWSLKADKTEVALKIDKDISPYSSKTTPVDSDLIPLSDSASSFGIKKLSWANIKATLKTYLDTLYQSLSKVAYDVDASIYIPNTLASGAIIERGSNANGTYIKYADGTLICSAFLDDGVCTTSISNFLGTTSGTAFFGANVRTFPHSFESVSSAVANGFLKINSVRTFTNTTVTIDITHSSSISGVAFWYIAIGRWE